jgi:RNA polymerase sigma-70 factor (ECF subfamily)
MRKAIAEELTPKQRAAIMAELGGMPFDQVCSLLGTSRNAGYKLLHDARRALKRHLEEAGITGYDIQLAFTT